MEKKIFDWEDWDEIETGVYQFTNITLKCQVGKFSPKSKFGYATIDYNKATLTLGTGDWGNSVLL